MKKTSVLCAALALAALPIGIAQAEVCYKLDSFSDVIRLDIQINDDVAGRGHQDVHGSWISPGYNTYPVSGARELVLGSSTVRHLFIIGSDNVPTTLRTCALDGIPAGAWKLMCTDGVTNSGVNMARVSCPPQPISGPMAGKAATRR
jgi:hypothetical protein